MIPDPADRGKFKFHKWDGADAPTQNGFDVNIRQTAAQAVLHWRTFNVGRDTTLNFDQSAGGAEAGKWTVLNKVFDPKGRMTEVYGRIQGQGQVHMINRTGFVFRPGSSVEARSIVVSSLPINDNLVERGLINQNPKNVQFLFSGLARDGFDRDIDLDDNKLIEAGKDYLASTPSGDVMIEAGARLAARTSAEKVGGRITLAGANVRNHGTLSTPDGQTIIAAGRQVGFDAHPTTDPTLRGLDVYVGEVDNTSGEAVNAGLIDAPRANVTMAGRRVRQLGVIKSATSTALNGRVDLLANFNAKTYTDVTGEGNDYPSAQASTTPLFYAGESGIVELGEGSLISILPDKEGTERAIGTRLALSSLVNMQGRAIHLGAGSVIHAPGASLPSGGTLAVDGSRDSGSSALLAGVTLRAGNWIRTQGAVTRWANSDRKLDAAGQPYVGGQIYFEPGAVIDVSGSVDVPVPLSNLLLTVQLRGAELANSPLQRDGAVRGTSITIDLRRNGIFNGQYWLGTPLGDVTGYASIIERSIAELTANGGTVSLAAGEAIVMQPGSLVDVSGGTRQISGGKVSTTRLVSGRQLVDIANATPDRIYDGVYTGLTSATSAKWGVSKTYRNALAPTGEHYQEPYFEGADAGRVTISAASMALDGQLKGQAAQGPRQLNPSERNAASSTSLARGGSLQLSLHNQGLSDNGLVAQSPSPPDITFTLSGVLPAADPFGVCPSGIVVSLREDRKKKFFLSPELLGESGFADLTVDNSDGNITVPAGTPLIAPLLGSVSMSAANISIGAPITAPGGNLSLTVYNYSPYDFRRLNGTIFEPPTPAPDPNRGIFSLASGATLSTAGLVTDRRPGFAARDAGTTPLVTGGSISINAFTARLDAGSVIDASGGVAVSSTGRRSFGSGGNISIAAGNDPVMKWLVGGKLFLGSALRSYSGGRLAGIDANGNAIYPGDSRFRGYMDGSRLEAKGGELSIQGPAIQVGGTAPAGMAAGDLLHLSPDFFTRGGFTAYNLAGLTVRGGNLPGVLIAPGTVIEPSAENLRLSRVGGKTTLQPFRRTDGLATPVSISFNSPVLRDDWDATGALVSRGDIVMGAGARIQSLPSASVRFQGGTVAILGSVFAPGGNITVRGADSFPLPVASDLRSALPSVNLGPRSVLSAAGTTVSLPDPFGRKAGRVLPGGSITVAGNIVAEAGSVLDVSGTSGVFDVHPSRLVKNILSESRNGSRVPPNSGVTTRPFATRGVSTRIDSDAGRIALLGSQELFVDATLRGFAGGPSAQGGTLIVSSGRFIDAVPASALDKNLIVRQSGNFIPGAYYPAGQTAIGNMVPVADGSSALGRGWFAVDRFTSGGFDSLKLSGGPQGAVSFEGPVSIAARWFLDVAEGGVIFADAAVDLSAPYIKAGTAFQPPMQIANAIDDGISDNKTYAMPTSGPGSLSLRGSLIDIGNLSLQGISTADLNAIDGDIRGNGALNIAGTLNLSAGQIYPTTASLFTIAAFDPNVVVLSSSTASRTVKLASDKLPAGFGVCTKFLGSVVTAVAGDTVTLAANANADISAPTLLTFAPGEGSVNVASGGARPAPLSAGGTLSIYAANILQSGTLRAPFGTINLGWDGQGTSPKDYLSGAGMLAGRSLPVAQQLTLAPGSVTSVSGAGLVIPYGFSPDGSSWIDPTGVDITGIGPPVKSVNMTALSFNGMKGSVVDVSGGGDLYAYRWVQGNGGSHDLLGSPSADWSASTGYESGQLVWHDGAIWSARRANQGVKPSLGLDWAKLPGGFAVLPNTATGYAPFAAFNDRTSDQNLARNEPGLTARNLSVGDRIYLGASPGLAAGFYTLLPARYALLPGGVFVSPKTTSLFGPVTAPEGASIVAGYRFNGFRQLRPPALLETFEVVPGTVLAGRVKYDGFLASRFLKQSAEQLGVPVARLPQDAGRALVSGLNSLSFGGLIKARGQTGGYGAEIDFNTLRPISISQPGVVAQVGQVGLDASLLSSFGADSLLVGGTRQTADSGKRIVVNTPDLRVEVGATLSAPEVILVAKGRLEAAPCSSVLQKGSTFAGASGSRAPLLIGDTASAGSGNGVLMLVSDHSVPISRSGVSSQMSQSSLLAPPQLIVGAGATLAASSLVLDSTYGMRLHPTGSLVAGDTKLQAGQISVQLDESGAVPVIPGLMLDRSALAGLQKSGDLSLLSYSAIDLYGSGVLSSAGSLRLDAAQLRGFNNNGGTLSFSAPEILLGNALGGTPLAVAPTTAGRLLLDTGALRLGAGNVAINNFATVDVRSAAGVGARATGSLSVGGSLSMQTPFLTIASGAYAIQADGAATFSRPVAANSGNLVSGLGARLSLAGASIALNTDIFLPAGTVNLRATAGSLDIGNRSAALIDVGGAERVFGDIVRYADAGSVSLTAANGNIRLGASGWIHASALCGGGNAGSVVVAAPNGGLLLAGTLAAHGGNGGSFSLDVASAADITAFDAALNAGGFRLSRSYRIRHGDVRLAGAAVARDYSLFADRGSVLLAPAAQIDASGATGGNIRIGGGGSVTLDSGSTLSVRGRDFDSAGKGGSIVLEAGNLIDGRAIDGRVEAGAMLNVRGGSSIDLSVAAQTAESASRGQFSGTLYLRAPRTIDDVNIAAIDGSILGGSSVVVEASRVFGDPRWSEGEPNLASRDIFAGGAQSAPLRFEDAVSLPSWAADSSPSRVPEADGTDRIVWEYTGQRIRSTADAEAFFRFRDGSRIRLLPAQIMTLMWDAGEDQSIRLNVPAIASLPDGRQITLDANASVRLPGGTRIQLIDSAEARARGELVTSGRDQQIKISVPAMEYVQVSGALLGMEGDGTLESSTVTYRYIENRSSKTIEDVFVRTAEDKPVVAMSGTFEKINYVNTRYFGNSYYRVRDRLAGPASAGGQSFVFLPGSEVVNPAGDLILRPHDSSTLLPTRTDWDLSRLRFGPLNAPGVLTLRAAGDIVFNNSLSDGFVSSLYTSQLLDRNTALPANVQSWSYRITAGSDFAAADGRATRGLDELAATDAGSIKIGKLYADNNGVPFAEGDYNARTVDVIGDRYAQMIRTGSGNIELSAGRNVQLLNQFATVYSAGTRVADPTLGGRFEIPPSVRIGSDDGPLGVQQQNPTYAAQFSLGGGNITVAAQGNIERLTLTDGALVADSQKQIPNNWLYRRGYIDPQTGLFGRTRDGDIGSTAWWVDFSNFFQGIGALGGGHVRMVAGNDISNVDAVAPTSGRVTYRTDAGDLLPANQTLVELGGGDVTVMAGRDIDAGIYYVERGSGLLRAGRDIITNPTRTAYASLGFGTDAGVRPSEAQWLPTTLFLGKGAFDVRAAGNVTLGPAVNPFLLPIGINNSFFRKSYFSTYAADSAVNVASLGGKITLRSGTTSPGLAEDKPILLNWMESVHLLPTENSLARSQPWLRLGETSILPFSSMFSLSPGTLRATALSGGIDLAGSLTLSPSAQGTVELAAAGSVQGLQPRGVIPGLSPRDPARTVWASSTINLSDADPANIPGFSTPFAYQVLAGTEAGNAIETGQDFMQFVDRLFAESGSSTGQQASIQTQQALHGRSLLHASDSEPLRVFAQSGSISGLTLFSPKAAQLQAGLDLVDVALYIQNTKVSDVSSVRAGRDIVPFNANEPSRAAAQKSGGVVVGAPLNGDIQISGPGSLLVQAGRDLDLGTGANNLDGTGVGITSIGNARNPNLPFAGADLYLGAGLGGGEPDYEAFIELFIENGEGRKYFGEIATLKGGKKFEDLAPQQQKLVALQIFYLVLRDAGREQQKGGGYDKGFEAICTLFPDAGYAGEIRTRTRDIRTRSGGNISIFAPGGGLTLATASVGKPLLPPGIVTEAGGNIGIFTEGDVNIGISRIFTLRGGNQIIWSSSGDIAAGASSKTVQSAPPTRVLVDPQTAELKVDLGGLATGGGIGVLASVAGVEPGSVDLIAPEGVVDAGDAGIRATGNLSIAATQVLNADNISVGGTQAGVPSAPVVATPNVSGLTVGATANAATSSAAQDLANQANPTSEQPATPSIITVEVVGYGGPSEVRPREEEEDEEDRRSAAL